MASKLSSYLVKQDLIPVKKLERAFKRQAIRGGTLDTTLIEMGDFDELSILRCIVEVSGIPTLQMATLTLDNIKELVLAFPRKLAQTYSVVPVTIYKDIVGVLVSSEIKKVMLEEMGFQLGKTLVPRVVPELRLWEIARQVYGFQLPPRMETLLAKMGPTPVYPAELVEDFDLKRIEEERNTESSPAPLPTPEVLPATETPPATEVLPPLPLPTTPQAASSGGTSTSRELPPVAEDVPVALVESQEGPSSSCTPEEEQDEELASLPSSKGGDESSYGEAPVQKEVPGRVEETDAADPDVTPVSEISSTALVPNSNQTALPKKREESLYPSEDDGRATLVMRVHRRGGTLPDGAPQAGGANVTRDDDDPTPVPTFEYTEKEISSDVLIPTINSGEKATSSASQPESHDGATGFSEEVTRPGFTLPEEHRGKKIKDLYLLNTQEKTPGLPLVSSNTPKAPLFAPVSSGDAAPETSVGPSDQGLFERSSEPDVQGAPESPSAPVVEVPAAPLEPVAPPTPGGALFPDLPPSDRTTPMRLPTSGELSGGGGIVGFEGSAITLVELVSGLMDMEHRDEMLIYLLRYASNFVEFAYLFTVSGDAARGKLALFNGQVDQNTVKNYLIALDFPSLLADALRSTAFAGAAPQDEGNTFVYDHLSLGSPANVLAYPIAIGKRVVAILFGASDREFPENLFNDMTTAAISVSKGLLRLIKDKKIARSIDSLKKIQSSKKLRVVKKFRRGTASLGEPLGVPSIPTKEERRPEVTVPLPTSRDSDHMLERIIALFDRLEHRSHQEGSLDIEAATELEKHTSHTLEVLSFYFPGMITHERDLPIERLPVPSACGPLLAFAVHWGLPCVPVLIDLLDSDTPAARFYAVYLFSEIRLPEVLYRVGEKLFDPDEAVRKIAGRVLLSYEGHKELLEIINNLKGFLDSDETFLQHCSVEAIGRLRDRHSIVQLFNLLDRRDPELSALVTRALRHITLRDFGDKRERWNSWWALNNQRHRILWLIEGLRASDRELREEAHLELLRIVGSSMGYTPSLEGEATEFAIRTWISWWEQKGRHIFPG